MEHSVDCPKCNGSGKVTRKYIILKDKDKKYCPSCDKILDRTAFYRIGKKHDSYCKECKYIKQKSVRTNFKKHELKCEVCGITFFSRRKNQLSCSRACNSKRLQYYRHKKLYNTIVTDVDERLDQ